MNSFIKFSNKLTKHGTSYITYSGYLFQNNVDSVSIVYGFGKNWEHTEEKVMEKTDEGFVAKVEMFDDYDLFNYCFKGSNGMWDNNNFVNYSNTVLEPDVENHFIINENVIDKVLTEMIDIDLSPVSSRAENSQVVDFTAEETPIAEPEYFDVEVIEETPVDIEDSIASVTDVDSLNRELEAAFAELYSENSESSDEKSNLLSDIISEQVSADESNDDVQKTVLDMNSLINEILDPIISSSTFDQDTYKSIIDYESSSDMETGKEFAEKEFEELSVPYSEEALAQDAEVNAQIENIISEISNVAKENVEFVVDNSAAEALDILDSFEGQFDLAETAEEEKVSNVEMAENDAFEIENLINELNKEVSLIDEYTNQGTDFSVDNIEVDDSPVEENKSLVSVDDKKFVVSARSLSKFYLFRKRIKLALYKAFRVIPQMLGLSQSKDED